MENFAKFRRYAAVEPRIKRGLASPWGGKTLCLSHLWASHHGPPGASGGKFTPTTLTLGIFSAKIKSVIAASS
jgi:hypothetical protein